MVTLNEECGFIQWVPNTIPIRPVLLKGYEARRVRSWVCVLSLPTKFSADAIHRPETWPRSSKGSRTPTTRKLVKCLFRRYYHCMRIYNLTIYIDSILRIGSYPSSTTGLSKLSQNLQHGLRAGWHTDGQLQSCRWLGLFWGLIASVFSTSTANVFAFFV